MAQQTTHPNDIIEVENIDLNCDEVQQEVIRTSKRVQDPETGQWSTLYEEQVYEFNHGDYFQCLWDLRPFRIEPGKTRLMPRYIAEHYAKHLANHMLGKEERQSGRQGLIQSNVARPRMLARIMKRVVEYYQQGELLTPGEQAEADFARLNPKEEARAVPLGTVPPTAVGVLAPEPPSLDQIMKEAGSGSEEPTETAIAPSEAANPAPLPAREPETTPPAQSPVVDDPAALETKPVIKDTKANGQAPANPSDSKTSIFDPKKPLPPRSEVIKVAYEMGVQFNPKDSTERIAALIRKF